MARHQQGHIYEASGSFYVRYRATQIVDGKAIREQCSQWLCEKDGKRYKNVKDKNVKLLRDKFMLTVNESGARKSPREITSVDFYQNTHLPFITANLRVSTVHGYAKIWKQHSQVAFRSHDLEGVSHASRFAIAYPFVTTRQVDTCTGRFLCFGSKVSLMPVPQKSANRNVWSAAVLQAKNEGDGIGLRECIRPLLE
jgi:hypothetical protein